MSNAFAIAAVTRVLKDLLNDGMIDRDVSSAVGNVTVTALPPDRVANGDGRENNQLNLFLYHVSPNAGWRNVGLPSRDASGIRTESPPLALDLHYLMTAYGADELNAEILLGYGMQLLHETPVLTRTAIREALGTPPEPAPLDVSILPPALHAIAASDLAEQVELIKITPTAMSTEELSKLWSALMTHYRPTAAYHISVVLIESAKQTRVPLPVLSRGAPIDDRDQGPFVQLGLTLPYPALSEILLPNHRFSAHLRDQVILKGTNLSRAAGVCLIHSRFPETGEQIIRDRDLVVTPTTITLAIPSDLPAGTYAVVALIEEDGEREQRTTNALPLMLAPEIITPGPTASRSPEGVTVSINFQPAVRPGQPMSLLLGSQQIPLPSPDRISPVVTHLIRDLPAATYPLRLRIDGVEDDIIDDRSSRPPRFRGDLPRVTVL